MSTAIYGLQGLVKLATERGGALHVPVGPGEVLDIRETITLGHLRLHFGPCPALEAVKETEPPPPVE